MADSHEPLHPPSLLGVSAAIETLIAQLHSPDVDTTFGTLPHSANSVPAGDPPASTSPSEQALTQLPETVTQIGSDREAHADDAASPIAGVGDAHGVDSRTPPEQTDAVLPAFLRRVSATGIPPTRGTPTRVTPSQPFSNPVHAPADNLSSRGTPPRTRFSPGGLSAVAAALVASSSTTSLGGSASSGPSSGESPTQTTANDPDDHGSSSSGSARPSLTAAATGGGKLTGPALQAAWRARREAALAAIIGAGDLGSTLQQQRQLPRRQFAPPSPRDEEGAGDGAALPDHADAAAGAQRRPAVGISTDVGGFSTAVSSPSSDTGHGRGSVSGSVSGSTSRAGSGTRRFGSPRVSPRAAARTGHGHGEEEAGAAPQHLPQRAAAARRRPGDMPPAAAPVAPTTAGASANPAVSSSSSSPSPPPPPPGGVTPFADLSSLVASRVAALDAEIGRYRALAAQLKERSAELDARASALSSEAAALAALKGDTEAWCAAARAAAAAALEGARAEVETRVRVAVRQARAEAAAAAAGPGERSLRGELEEARSTIHRLRGDLASSESRYRDSVERARGAREREAGTREALAARVAELTAALEEAHAAGAAAAARFTAARRDAAVSGAGFYSAVAVAPPGPSSSVGPYDPTRYGPLASARPLGGHTVAGATHETEDVDAAAARGPPESLAPPACLPSPFLAWHLSVSPSPSPSSSSTDSSGLQRRGGGAGGVALGTGVREDMASGTRHDLALLLERPLPPGGGNHGAGRVERRYTDGTRVVVFPDGTEREERLGPPHGCAVIILRYANGDVKQVVSRHSGGGGGGGDGPQRAGHPAVVEAYWYAETGTLHTSYWHTAAPRGNSSTGPLPPDVEVFQFSSGQVEMHTRVREAEAGELPRPGGAVAKEVLFPDGTCSWTLEAAGPAD